MTLSPPPEVTSLVCDSNGCILPHNILSPSCLASPLSSQPSPNPPRLGTFRRCVGFDVAFTVDFWIGRSSYDLLMLYARRSASSVTLCGQSAYRKGSRVADQHIRRVRDGGRDLRYRNKVTSVDFYLSASTNLNAPLLPVATMTVRPALPFSDPSSGVE